ncbi:MAG TPA: hypothetical protein VLB09_05315, partial [Nitrospiria bacterium]|nr:hypothetical protein [Nitrospiria bacterium]
GEGFVNGVLASIACQSAVKANQKMANDQIQGLMEDLYREEVPPTCPHGRPIRVRFNRADLERMFHRR